MKNNKRSTASNYLPFASLALAISMAGGVQAQPMVLEEVIVTAQKRSQSLQDVPISVSAVTGKKLADAGITNLGDLSAYVPNFQKTDTALGPMLLIRGIGSGVNQGFEQSVVQYSDEISMGRAPLARMPFMDIERIEILRGPQNVLFGKNSIGGALSITTNRPSDSLEGSVSLDYEPKHDQHTATAIISGPLSDSLRGRLVLRAYEESGYFENTATGKDEAERDEFALRAIIAWDMTVDASLELKVERANFDSYGRNDEIFQLYPNTSGAFNFLIDGQTYPEIADTLTTLSGQDFGSDRAVQDYKRATNFEEYYKVEANNVTLKITGTLNNIDIASVTGWVDYSTDDRCDCDFTGFEILDISSQEDYKQLSQELRFTSTGDDAVDWIAGVFYQDTRLNYDSGTIVDDQNLFSALGALGDKLGIPYLAQMGNGANSSTTRAFRTDSDMLALFGQATWKVKEGFRLTLGARYTVENKKGSRTMDSSNAESGQFDLEQAVVINTLLGVDQQSLGEYSSANSITAGEITYEAGNFPTHTLKESRDEESFTPSLTAEWDFGEDSMLYGSVASGFKAGGFDARGNLEENFEYEDEAVLTYELGTKNRLAGGLAELNAAVFYTQYKDLQVSQFDGRVGYFVGNAPRATTQGIEIDGRTMLARGLMLTGSLAYLDFEFKEYIGACSTLIAIERAEPGALCDYAGMPNTFSPEISASVGLNYTKPLSPAIDILMGIDVNYADDQFVEVTLYEPLKQPAYTKVNARIGLKAENWHLSLIGQNLTDEEVIAFINPAPLAGGDPFFAPAYVGYYERPLTVAIQAAYRFK